jgi:hypothetical protein
VTVTSDRTNPIAHHIGGRLSLPGTLAFGTHLGKLYADIRTFTFLGTPAVKSVRDYLPFALEDGSGRRIWRLNLLIV